MSFGERGRDKRVGCGGLRLGLGLGLRTRNLEFAVLLAAAYATARRARGPMGASFAPGDVFFRGRAAPRRAVTRVLRLACYASPMLWQQVVTHGPVAR